MHLDPRRPRAKHSAEWLETTLTEAKARALGARKPVLVHFFRESNAWCYRYGFYTFPDRQVDALLRRFVLVRIDVDKDPEHSFRELGGGSLPALLPLSPNGRPIEFRLRTRDAQGKVGDLGPKKEHMVTGWQRPQELITNLQRILAASGE